MSALAIVAELARVKVLFQRRAIVAAMGLPVQDSRPSRISARPIAGPKGWAPAKSFPSIPRR